MKNLYFVFYQDNDYLSDRLLILYDRVNPAGIWKFINIYDNKLLYELPIRIESLPAVYNVLDKELYLGEYLFEFLRSFDSVKYRRYLKTINERLEERDDNEIETVQKTPTLQRISREDTVFRPSYQYGKINNVYEDDDIELYEATIDRQREKEMYNQMENLNPYDQSLNDTYSFSNNYDNYPSLDNTEIINENERGYIHTINNQIQGDYEKMKNDRNSDLRNHKSKKSISFYEL